MSYYHWWERPVEIDKEAFRRILFDFKRVLPVLESKHKVKLSQECTLNDYAIQFNGSSRCRHRSTAYYEERETMRYWEFNEEDYEMQMQRRFERRGCGGNCAGDLFVFPRIAWQSPGLGDPTRCRCVCRTERHHYDLAVQTVLLCTKAYLGNEIQLEGVEEHWEDVRKICQRELGYGRNLKLFEPRDPSSEHDWDEVEQKLVFALT